MEDVPPELDISPESSFYGDEETKRDWNSRASAFNPADWWAEHGTNSSAATAASAPLQPPTTIPKDDPSPSPSASTTLSRHYNPYAGSPGARQNGESVSSFLARLPVLTTRELAVGSSWLWITNPRYAKDHRDRTAQDLAGLGREGAAILREWMAEKTAVENSMQGKAKGAVTRAVNVARAKVERSIAMCAKERGVVCGKWMLFPSDQYLERTWEIVANGVDRGELGPVAKVATVIQDAAYESKPRLICIYTRDFTDFEDVKRVLSKMVELDLIKKDSKWGIYYKCDAYTHLGISNGNEWGFKASLYSSKDLLKGEV